MDPHHTAGPRPRGAPVVVGHRGARALAPENTRAGLRAGLAAGAATVELDVRRDPRGALVLAHSRRQARGGRAWALGEALAALADLPAVDGPAGAGPGLMLDVKEADVVEDLARALDRAGLAGRTIACARDVATLAHLGRAAPSVRRAWSLKRVRHARAARLGGRRIDVPAAIAVALDRRLAELVSIHRGLVDRRLVAACHAAGGEVYVWGATERRHVRALAALGVDGIVLDDPRLAS